MRRLTYIFSALLAVFILSVTSEPAFAAYDCTQSDYINSATPDYPIFQKLYFVQAGETYEGQVPNSV
jgi:ABC-type cobalt transport system substrate-binding protein